MDPVEMLVFPVPKKQGPRTVMVRVGECGPDEMFEVEISYDGNNWVPWALDTTNERGQKYMTATFAGGPRVLRGTIGMYPFRVRLVKGSGAEIPVHIMVDVDSYVGSMSCKGSNSVIIDEEPGIEDLLNTP